MKPGRAGLILDALQREPTTNQRELARLADVSLGTANRLLRQLAEAGCLQIEGSLRRRRYMVTPKGASERWYGELAAADLDAVPGAGGAGRWLDVTAALGPELPVYPGDRPFSLCWNQRLEQGGVCNLSSLELGSHSGTHVDAPLHFVPGGTPVDLLPLETFCGPCRVVEISDERKADLGELKRLLRGKVPERLLLRTSSSRRGLMKRREFAEDFAFLTPEAAEWLAAGGVRLVGIDYLSIERFGFTTPDTHRALLGAGVPIVEGLDLSEAGPGSFELLCLPLRVEGADGAPARAALRRVP